MSRLLRKLEEIHPEFARIFLYFCIGISAATLDYAVFYVLHNYVDVIAELSTAMSTSIAVVYAFTLNVRYNFKIKTHLFKRFVSYFAVSLVGMLIGIGLIYFFGTRGSFDPNIIKIVSLPIVFVVQFALNRLITFHGTPFSK